MPRLPTVEPVSLVCRSDQPEGRADHGSPPEMGVTFTLRDLNLLGKCDSGLLWQGHPLPTFWSTLRPPAPKGSTEPKSCPYVGSSSTHNQVHIPHPRTPFIPPCQTQPYLLGKPPGVSGSAAASFALRTGLAGARC